MIVVISSKFSHSNVIYYMLTMGWFGMVVWAWQLVVSPKYEIQFINNKTWKLTFRGRKLGVNSIWINLVTNFTEQNFSTKLLQSHCYIYDAFGHHN